MLCLDTGVVLVIGESEVTEQDAILLRNIQGVQKKTWLSMAFPVPCWYLEAFLIF